MQPSSNRMSPARSLLGLGFAVLACSRPAAAPEQRVVAPVEPAGAAGGSREPRSGASSSAVKPAPSAAAQGPQASPFCSPGAGQGTLAATKFSRLQAGPVSSMAVGTPPRAATWSGRTVTLFDGERSRELPAPRLPPGAAVELFFGRDNQPRLMGFAPGEPGKQVPVYLRFRQGTFRPEPSELGPLAPPRGALYGVLDFADPEVVCRPHELCLVKRTTGWGRVAAHESPARIVLTNGGVFALREAHVERLGERGFAPLEPARTFDRPLDAWLAPNGELWIADRSASGLFRERKKRWEAVVSPVREPRAIVGRSERDVFVAGANGAARFDGAHFHCVEGVDGPLHLALLVGNEVWLAGESGVYRSEP